MKRFALFLVSSVLLLATSPVLAQPGPGPGPERGPMWGYGHMWGGSGGWGGGMHGIIGPFVILLAIVGLVALILWLVRAFSHGGYHHGRGHGVCPHCGYGGPRGGAALDILGERFARGEIGKEEFEEKRRLLGR